MGKQTALLKHETAKLSEEEVRNDPFLAVRQESGLGAEGEANGHAAQQRRDALCPTLPAI